MADDELHTHCWKRRHETMHHIRVSVLYHLRRERFFDGLDKLVSAATAVSATAAVAVLLRDAAGAEKALAVATAALAMVPLVYNPAQRARLHGQMAAEFRNLLAECERAGEYWAESDCDNFASRATSIEARGEPYALTGLLADCENRLAAAAGQPLVADVKWWHRLVMHWVDVQPAALPQLSRS